MPGETIGGWFDQIPWFTFNAPIINEDPSFAEVRHFPKAFVKYNEIDQLKGSSREKVNVLLSLDPAKLNSANPGIHRTDHDFAVAWSKTYGKGRVFYSSNGHTEESWDDPEIRKMYLEAIKWDGMCPEPPYCSPTGLRTSLAIPGFLLPWTSTSFS